MARRKEAVYNRDFQAHMLACIVQSPEAAAMGLSYLESHLLDDQRLKEMLKITRRLWNRNKELPTRSLIAQKMGKDQFIDRLFKEKTHDWRSAMELGAELARTRALHIAVLQSAEILAEDKNSDRVGDIIDKAMQVGQDLGIDDGEDLAEGLEAFAAEYTNPSLAKIDRVPTGIAHMDEVTGGGLNRGELGVILADAKRGKSHSLIQIGFGAASWRYSARVLHVSFELTRKVLTRRYHRRIAGPALKYLKDAPDRFVAELKARTKAFVRGSIRMVYRPTRTMGATGICQMLDRAISNRQPYDVLIVDYGNIMKAERRLGSRREEEASCFEDIRRIAGMYNLASWSAAQSNRDGSEKDIVTKKYVGESYEIAQVVDALWSLNQTPEQKDDNRCTFYGAAIRELGDGALIDCNVDYSRSLFTSLGIVPPERAVKSRKKEAQEAKIERVMKSKRVT